MFSSNKPCLPFLTIPITKPVILHAPYEKRNMEQDKSRSLSIGCKARFPVQNAVKRDEDMPCSQDEIALLPKNCFW